MYGCGPKYFSERLTLESVYKACKKYPCAANSQSFTQVQHKMFKTIHNSVNISPTEIILVSK